MATRDIVVSPPLRIPAFLYKNPTDLSSVAGRGTALGWHDEIMIVWGRTSIKVRNKLSGYLNEVVETEERFAIIADQRNFDPDTLALLYPHNFPTTSVSTKPALSDNSGVGQRILSQATTTKILLVPKEVNRHPGALLFNPFITTRESESSIIHQIDTDFKFPIAFEAAPDGGATQKVYQWRLLKDMTLS